MDYTLKQQQYDSALLGILSNEITIQPFLDVIFGFLYRRTDFYRIKNHEYDRLGFPPNVAESIVHQTFQKYQLLASEDETNKHLNISQCDKITDDLSEASISNIDHEEVIKFEETDDSDQSDKNIEAISKTKNSKKFDTAASDSYNGANRDTYIWSQTILDLDIRIKVPKTVKKGNQVKVNMSRSKLSACLKQPVDGVNELVNDDLSWKINVENSLWTLIPGEYIHVSLAKVEERWWDSVFTNEPKIDLKKIDASRPIEDLDDESQSKVQELLFNEHQKKLGKPTSEQMKVANILEEAWDKEGSPFKGQPYDPSIVQIQNNGCL